MPLYYHLAQHTAEGQRPGAAPLRPPPPPQSKAHQELVDRDSLSITSREHNVEKLDRLGEELGLGVAHPAIHDPRSSPSSGEGNAAAESTTKKGPAPATSSGEAEMKEALSAGVAALNHSWEDDSASGRILLATSSPLTQQEQGHKLSKQPQGGGGHGGFNDDAKDHGAGKALDIGDTASGDGDISSTRATEKGANATEDSGARETESTKAAGSECSGNSGVANVSGTAVGISAAGIGDASAGPVIPAYDATGDGGQGNKGGNAAERKGWGKGNDPETEAGNFEGYDFNNLRKVGSFTVRSAAGSTGGMRSRGLPAAPVLSRECASEGCCP